MQDLKLIQERTIVRYGLLKLTESEREQIYGILLVNIPSFPDKDYLNIKYPDHKSFYGYLHSYYQGDLIESVSINFSKQVLWEYKNDFGILLGEVNCLINDSTNEIKSMLEGGGIISPSEPIKPKELNWERLPVNEFRVTVYSNATVQLSFFGDNTKPYCESNIKWREPEKKPKNYQFKTPQRNPNLNEDLPSPPYTLPDDDGKTYNPQPGVPLPPNPGFKLVSIVHGQGILPTDCTPINNLGDYEYDGVVTLVRMQHPTGARCLLDHVFLNGESLPIEQSFYPGATVRYEYRPI